MDPQTPQNRQLKRMQASEERRAEKAKAKGGSSPSRQRQQQAPRERVGARQFVREVQAELRKVIWPTREQVVNSFFVVLATVLIMVALIFLLDTAFENLIKVIYQ